MRLLTCHSDGDHLVSNFVLRSKYRVLPVNRRKPVIHGKPEYEITVIRGKPAILVVTRQAPNL